MPDLYYDLHLHSCLSPCGDDDNTPGNIVGMSMIKGLNLIALTDHNTCRNCPAFLEIAEAYGLIALPGMELTTSEEVHVVCLFSELKDAMAFDSYVYERILPIQNKEAIFGKQQIMNCDDEEVGRIDRLLISATSISFDDVYDLVKSFNGIMIPAHIDKNANSLLAMLGFIPPDSQFTCVEVADMKNYHGLLKAHPYLENCRVISDSDAHYLPDINEPKLTLHVESTDRESILRALERKD